MATVHKVNGRVLTESEWEDSVEESAKQHKADGTDLRSGQEFSGNSGWPMHSDALAVWPGQAIEAEEHSRKIGVPTRFDRRTGKCILESREHRARYLKANGVHDKDGGYRET